MTFARPLARLALCLAALSLAPTLLHADDPSPFNLAGPKISVRVTRNGKTLPIAQVPNLQTGDKLWIHADLPADQSNHLLVIVAFLRGTTNLPPDNWFTKIETWDKKAQQEGSFVTIPQNAEQAILFIAPETGGDFESLRSTVKSKPGQFIRADSDLNEASFEQQRIERYLAAMKTVAPDDPKAIQDRSAKLAATLALQPKQDCFKQPVSSQVNCLTQTSAPIILDDAQGQNLAQSLSNNGAGDLVNQASYTQAVGAGVYSAYVGAVVDVVKLIGSLRNPEYQYIPGISFPNSETLNLKLNAPPSFKKPQSVIVVGLPAIQKNVTPQLRPQNPNQVSCLLQPNMTLLVTGAPLVFSTSFARDLTLHLNRTSGATDIPLKPDAFQGGLVADIKDAKPVSDDDKIITGTVRGNWGFDSFEGPTLKLQQTDSGTFKVVGDAQIIAGQDKKIELQGDATGCVQHIALVGPADHKQDVSFKPADGNDDKSKNTLDLTLPLKDAKPGDFSLLVQQFGKPGEDKVPLTAYNGAIKLGTVKIHAGDKGAVLTGDGVANVASVAIDKVDFTPTGKGDDPNTLHLAGKSAVSPKDGEDATARLKDGRTVPVKIETEAARPTLKLLSMKTEAAAQQGALPITLTGKDEIPLQGKLTFVLQSEKPFDRSQKVEVATVSGGAHTELGLADNTLMLQDEHTAIATLDPQKAFGDSAFGKLQMRPVAGDGTTGDWSPLGTLVRVPQITAIQCAGGAAANTSPTQTADANPAAAPPANAAPNSTCTVQGSRLFLVQSFSGTQDFSKPADVPTGFSDGSFTAPTPTDGSTLYLKLRDDPNSIASVKLPTPLAKPAAPAAAAPAAAVLAPSTPSGQAAASQPSAAAKPAPAEAPAQPAPAAQTAPAPPASARATANPATPPAKPESASPEPGATSPAQPQAAAPPQ